MTVSRRVLCIVYGLISVIALIGTWGNNLQYAGNGFMNVGSSFVRDTFANPASRSVTVDVLLLALAFAIWMLLEARRLRMKGVWLYLVFGLMIAISVTAPLFLIHRERALAKAENPQAAGTLELGDLIGLIAMGIAFTAYTVASLRGSPM